MKRRWFGVILALVASLGSLLSIATTAYAASSDQCTQSSTTYCITLTVKLNVMNGGAVNTPATIWVNRQSGSGIDNAFTLDSTGGNNLTYTSGGVVWNTAQDDSSCANTNNQYNPSNNPMNLYKIAVTGSATGATANNVNLCDGSGPPNASGPNGKRVKTVTIDVQATAAAPTLGGIKGDFNVIDLAGNVRACDNTATATFTGPTNGKSASLTPVTVNGKPASHFDTGLTLAEGDYDVQVNCVTGGGAGPIQVLKVHVTKGQTTDIGLKSCDPKVNNCGQAGGGPSLTPTPDPNAGSTPSDCDSADFTWIVCKLAHGVTSIIDWIRETVIVPLLKEPPLTTGGDYAKAYAIWQSVRNVASLFFILVFFLIIIGTAAGFDNYTIKKVLPHLIAGAILVPLSWYICALVIDLSNVLGQGMVVLLSPVIGDPEIDFTTGFDVLFFGAGGIMAVSLAYFAFATIGLGVLVTVLLAVLTTFFILILRRILIILFIILSPFALLAWVLPNTERWFRRWWTNYLQLVMVYPAFMLFVEAGRLFSATAGATFPTASLLGGPIHLAALGVPLLGATGAIAGHQATAATGKLIAVTGLWGPTLGFPWIYPKLVGEAGRAGGNLLNKGRGALDKKFGKDSDMAKEAKENRERNSIRRARRYGDAAKAPGVGGFQKKRLQALERINARRAGIPKGFKWTRGDQNESRELRREAAYSKAQAEHGIVGANNLNAKQGLPTETEEDRARAEILAAQNQKRADRYRRQGLVKDQDEMGGENSAAVREANLREYEGGLAQAKRDSATRRGTLIGTQRAERTRPQLSPEITEGAIEHGEAKGNAERAATAGAIEHGGNLDQIRMQAENARRATAGLPLINLEQAHQLRMNDHVKAGIANEGKHLLDQEVDVNTTNASNDDLDAQMRHAAGGAITLEQARRMRMQRTMAAATSKNRRAKIIGESEEQKYNEIEASDGGMESADKLMKSGGLLAQQGIIDDRTKHTGAIDADAQGRVPTTATLLAAGRASAANNFVASTSAQQGIANNLETDINAEAVRLVRASGGTMPMATARATAEANVRSRRLNAAADAGTSRGERAARKEVSADEGVATELENDIQKELRNLPAGTPRSVAEERVRRRNLGALGQATAEHAATAHRAEISAAVGTGQGIETQINEEATRLRSLTPGMSVATARAQATHTVEARNLDAAGEAARLQAQLDARRTNQTNIGASKGLAADIKAEKDAHPGLTDAQAEANVMQRNLDAVGTAAELASERKYQQERGTDLGTKTDLETQVRKMQKDNPGMSAADAEARVRATRITDAGNAARTEAERASAKQRGKDAGVTRDTARARAKAAKRILRQNKGTGMTQAQAEAQAEREVLDTGLGALATKATEESARSSRQEVKDAVGVQDAVNAEIEAQTAKLLAGGRGAKSTPAQIAAARAKATDLVEERNLYNAGEAARIAGQKSYMKNVRTDKGVVTSNGAFLKKAPIEAARNIASNAAYAQAMAQPDMTEEKALEIAQAAGETAAQAEEKRLAGRTVTLDEQRQAAIMAEGAAAEELAMRQESNAAGQVIGLNQAASAPNALNADQRITAQTESVVKSLAHESAAARAAYELTRPGQTLNRSYQATEAAATRVERSKILSERIDEANKKEFDYPVEEMQEAVEYELDAAGNPLMMGLDAAGNPTAASYDRDGMPIYKPVEDPATGKPKKRTNSKGETVFEPIWETEPDPATGLPRVKTYPAGHPKAGQNIPRTKVMRDTIGKSDINPSSIRAMKARIEELLGDGSQPPQNEDEAVALMINMSKTNQGRLAVQDIQSKIFGGDYYKNIDPERLGGRAREVWEQVQDKVPIKTAPYFTIPPAALYDGFSPEDFAQLGYAGKGQYFNYLNDVKQQSLYNEAARNIHEALTNPQVSKNLTSDDYQTMYHFLQDPSARAAVARVAPKTAGGKSGTDVLRQIHEQGANAGAAGKFSAEEAQRYNTWAQTENIAAGVGPGDPGYRRTDYKVMDRKPLKTRPDGSPELANNNPIIDIPVPPPGAPASVAIQHDALGEFLATPPTLVPPTIAKSFLDIAGDNAAYAEALATAYNGGPTAPPAGTAPTALKTVIDAEILAGNDLDPAKNAAVRAAIAAAVPAAPTATLPEGVVKKIKEQAKSAKITLDIQTLKDIADTYNDPARPEYKERVEAAMRNGTEIPLPTKV